MKCTDAFLKLRTRPRARRGFTLIELMIVVGILSILAVVAIPSYQSYNKRANRSAAAQIMLNIQNREEQFVLDARRYSDVLGPTELNIVGDGWTCSNTAATGCSNNFYKVTVTLAGPPPTYTITGVPKAGTYQAGGSTPSNSDGTLTLTSAGLRSRSAGDLKW